MHDQEMKLPFERFLPNILCYTMWYKKSHVVHKSTHGYTTCSMTSLGHGDYSLWNSTK